MKDGTEPATWKVYRCLNAEIDLKQKKYILNDGDWYNVDGNYVKEIEAYYASIPASSLALPKFGTKTEPTYLSVQPGAMMMVTPGNKRSTRLTL